MGGLLELIRGKKVPLEESWGDCLEMLRTTEEMVRLARSCRDAGDQAQARLRRLHEMDSGVNGQQEQIRRQVFTHLAVAEARDVSTTLKVLTIAIHLERVGDYAKNIAEVYLLLHGGADLRSEQVEVLSELDAMTVQMFRATREALVAAEPERAQEVVELARAVSGTCKHEIETTLCQDDEGEHDRSALAYVLLLRHHKRIASHLKNSANVVVVPIHKLR